MRDIEETRKYRREYMREYNQRPHAKEARIKRQKIYREKVDTAKLKRKRYLENEKHRENLLKENREWKKNNLEKVAIINLNRYLKLRSIEGSLTYSEILNILEEQGGKCPGCLKDFSEDLPYTIDHFIPISKGGINHSNNIQLLCRPCNCSKRASLWSDWINQKEAA